jgi:type I restriction enzyme M protein
LLTSRCHYPLKPVAQFAHVRGGKRLPPATPYIENHDGSGIPYVRTCDIRPESGAIDLSNVVYIDEATHRIIRNYQLQQNDIVISIAGTIGAVGMLREPLERCNFNENMAKVRVFDAELLPEYVAAYFDSSFGQAYIQWLAGGAVQAKLSLERIEQILVPVPSLKVQHCISQIMQDAYNEREQVLAQLEAGTLFDEAVLPRLNIRLNVDAFSKRFVLKNSEFLSSRDDYRYYSPESKAVLNALATLDKVAELGTLVESITNGTDCREYASVGVPYIRVAQVKYGMLDLSDVAFVSKEALASLRQVPIQIGDVLFTRKGSPGNTTVVDESSSQCVISSEIMRIKLKPDVLPNYFAAFCNSVLGKAQVERRLTGSLNYGINQRELRGLITPIPSADIQNKIANAVKEKQKEMLEIEKRAKEVIANAKYKVETLILGEDFSLENSAPL